MANDRSAITHYVTTLYMNEKRGLFSMFFFVTMSQNEGTLENPTLVATTEVELSSKLVGYCFAVGVLVVFKQCSPGKSVLRRQCLLKR